MTTTRSQCCMQMHTRPMRARVCAAPHTRRPRLPLPVRARHAPALQPRVFPPARAPLVTHPPAVCWVPPSWSRARCWTRPAPCTADGQQPTAFSALRQTRTTATTNHNSHRTATGYRARHNAFRLGARVIQATHHHHRHVLLAPVSRSLNHNAPSTGECPWYEHGRTAVEPRSNLAAPPR
jgi:hypothetical protein